MAGAAEPVSGRTVLVQRPESGANWLMRALVLRAQPSALEALLGDPPRTSEDWWWALAPSGDVEVINFQEDAPSQVYVIAPEEKLALLMSSLAGELGRATARRA